MEGAGRPTVRACSGELDAAAATQRLVGKVHMGAAGSDPNGIADRAGWVVLDGELAVPRVLVFGRGVGPPRSGLPQVVRSAGLGAGSDGSTASNQEPRS